jgi:hypothetical protein
VAKNNPSIYNPGNGLVWQMLHQPISFLGKVYWRGQIEYSYLVDGKPSTTFFRIDHYLLVAEPHKYYFFKQTIKQ